MNNPCQACERECPSLGCGEWRAWFVRNWNKNICVNPEPKAVQVFSYEHPDRLREMAAAQDPAEQKEDGDGER